MAWHDGNSGFNTPINVLSLNFEETTGDWHQDPFGFIARSLILAHFGSARDDGALLSRGALAQVVAHQKKTGEIQQMSLC